MVDALLEEAVKVAAAKAAAEAAGEDFQQTRDLTAVPHPI
jgi:hypothetical protein